MWAFFLSKTPNVKPLKQAMCCKQQNFKTIQRNSYWTHIIMTGQFLLPYQNRQKDDTVTFTSERFQEKELTRKREHLEA